MLRGGKELTGPQGGLGSDLLGGSQGSRETSLWDGMEEGAISRNMWAQWDKGPLPGSFEEEGREGSPKGGSAWGLEGWTGLREEGIPTIGWSRQCLC